MFILFFSTLILFSRYTVEESFATQITVSDNNNEKISISSSNMYKVNYDSKIVLLYNNKYNEYSIKFISKKDGNFIIDIEPVNWKNDKLIPGSIIGAQVVYSNETILNIILNYFK